LPVYEYECQKCGERFELRRSMSDSDQDIKCPQCEAENPRRVFSTFATTSSGGGSCAPSGST
jgi:putative FmdB family regulatory protein